MKKFTTTFPPPLKLRTSINHWRYEDLTRALGREYLDIDLVEVLEAPSVDDLLRDLAITISRRGLVVFRSQKNLTPAHQKYFTNRLGQLTGKPKDSAIHIHPINHTIHKPGEKPDLEMSTIARNPAHMLSKQTGVVAGKRQLKKQSVADGWHSDIAFERVTSDYTTLINRVRSNTGGDTIFASAYEVYERVSPPMRAFLETLTGNFSPVGYKPNPEHAHLYQVARGHPLNVDQSLTAEHPIVRTNPVTGWKAIFGVGHHLQSVNGLAIEESEWVKKFLLNLITDNHDLQVRVKWGENDLAVWDNRATYHTATYDYDGPRMAQRVVAVGEPPALDPAGVSWTGA
ncbi:hypothetical protein BGW36DRAFT_305869 [Talaromyces proteolyticus]|uniref:TauD/TfdA-like domain-containing protein n=1 Tax=Talaromyces proteolyticus TaxID=1131652 RepID=A0AAD4KK92_9EURO|nr:uncharacterized protein BGW36DRAFT_305869 [Talaromyces proteolyticus]KAH8690448.1 hypothetical protein BGW36DRAFT_305869 [Talaromyces proteolyticus]